MKNLIQLFNFKKVLFILAFIELFSLAAVASPGDTTWVTVFNNRKLTQYGDYDTLATFPTGVRFRKIRLHYILGRYACPAGSQYCGSWDYTTQIHARPAGKDSVEIARVITPYATDWLSASVNKSHDYIIDVTDYAPALEGATSMRYHYDGYSWGFTITLKLEMIEGTPPMDALSVKNAYDGYFYYGNTTNPIENYLTPKTFSYTSPVGKVYLKNTVSGHGSDNYGCSEFCSKYYQLKINGSNVAQKQLWRSDCGINNVYPQTGTWLFERGNWCPGAWVIPIYHDLTSLTSPNSTYSVDIDMQPYTSPNPTSTGYNFVSQVINYGSPNFATDVSIEDIKAPTKDDNYIRNNPTCTNPIVKIKNTGTAPVTSIVFNYGLKGVTPSTYTWTGNLNFLDETEVLIQPLTAIFTNTVETFFEVSIASVNGGNGDQNTYNNIYQSIAVPATIYPKDFVVKMFTNGSTEASTQKNETSWTLYDEYDNVIAVRNNLSNNTSYLDTLSLSPGCYRFQIDDSGCDGFSWWYYQYYTPNPGNGSLRIDLVGTNSTVATFAGDIGCSYTQYFSIMGRTSTVGIKTYATNDNIDVYPNPAQNQAYIKFDLGRSQNITYKITDINGRMVQQKSLGKITATFETVDISNLTNGVYFVSIQMEDGLVVNKKLVVQK